MSIALRPERREHVGASECGALFGVGFESRYRLYARKAGLLPHDGQSDALHLRIGTILEPAVAQLVNIERGWACRKVHRYSPHPTVAGMGASLDYEVVSHPDGPGVLEIKTTDMGQWLRWQDEYGGPPLHYELQLQHQLACVGRGWGAIAMLVSNRKLEIFLRRRMDDAIAKIEGEIPKFWLEVAERRAPEPDYRVDADTLVELFRDVTAEKVIDLSLDDEAQRLAVEYKRQAAIESAAEKAKKAAKAALLERVGDAELAFLPYGRIKSKHIEESQMPAYTKRAYRTWSVTVEDVDGEGGE